MPRTILEIAREAAQRENTAPPPATLFGNNVKVARTLVIAANDTLRELLRKTSWQGLSESHSTWVFALRPGRYAYPMPPDFLRAIPYTEQRNGWPMGLVGPASPRVWSEWVFGGQAVTAPMGWRIRNNVLFLSPTPAATELVAIEYVSRYPVVSTIRAGDYDFSAGVPTAVAPLVARDGWLDLDDPEIFSLGTGATAVWDEGAGWDEAVWPKEPSEIMVRINPLSGAAPLPQVRRPEFSADTDEPFTDDDHLLSLGMTFRLRRSLGMPFTESAAEYEHEMEVKMSTDAGGPRDFMLGGSRCDDEVVPLGDGNWLVS